MKDALDAQGRAEEQRQHEAARLVRTPQPPLQGALRNVAQGKCGRQEEEGASEVGAPDEGGREASASPVVP